MTKPSYDVVIVNYQGEKVLGPCLDALLGSTLTPTQIIVHDNASQDGSLQVLAKHYPNVQVIACPDNLGFAKGNNRALEKVASPYVLYLNNDVCVEPDCAKQLLQVLEENPTAAIVNPVILHGWGADAHEVYSFGAMVDTAGFCVNALEVASTTVPTFSFSGACFMARTEVMRANPFEEHFFLYYEEPELSIRLHAQGKEVLVTPQATAKHLTSHGSPKGALAGLAFRQFYGIQNRWFMLGKHWPTGELARALGLNLLHLLYFCTVFIRAGQYQKLAVLYLAPANFFQGRRQRYAAPTRSWFAQLRPASLGSMLAVKQRVYQGKS